ncbi:hypothetical protein [Oerskovia enterophila]|uniref:hypothetical protein n=1 Tax=Oerskovia enterophila TaxID=43678 RepID=UPI001E36605E|nr:hypothetical protein [Oerskovia enterophila]
MSDTDLTALAESLRAAAGAYYDTDELRMSDAEYDSGIEQLRIAVAADPSLAGRFADLLDAVAAGQSAGGDVEHPTMMGSLDKAPNARVIGTRSTPWCSRSTARSSSSPSSTGSRSGRSTAPDASTWSPRAATDAPART